MSQSARTLEKLDFIRQEGRRGQQSIESAAEDVGRRVRRTMEEISGHHPEELPPAADIKVVRKKLQSANREFRKLDRPAKADESASQTP